MWQDSLRLRLTILEMRHGFRMQLERWVKRDNAEMLWNMIWGWNVRGKVLPNAVTAPDLDAHVATAAPALMKQLRRGYLGSRY